MKKQFMKLFLVAILALTLLQNPTSAAPGDLDPMFGSGGKVVLTALGHITNPHVAYSPFENKYVVAASLSGYYTWIAKLNNDGSYNNPFFTRLDSYIGPDGVIHPQRVMDVKIQTTGKILILAEVDDVSMVTRFNSDGTLDTTFGTGGRAFVGFSAMYMELAPTQSIILAGNVQKIGTFDDFGVAKLTPNGAFDTYFGVGGETSVSFTSCSPNAPTYCDGDHLTDLKILPDGRILLIGNTSNVSRYVSDIAIARLNGRGGLDWTFDSDGKLVKSLPPSNGSTNKVAILSDGTFVVSSESSESLSRWVQWRMFKFSGSGALLPNSLAAAQHSGYSANIDKQTDDKIVFSTSIYNYLIGLPGGIDFFSHRLNPDLSVDAWGYMYQVKVDFTPPLSATFNDDFAEDIVIDSSNRTLIAGETKITDANGNYPRTALRRIALVRLLPN